MIKFVPDFRMINLDPGVRRYWVLVLLISIDLVFVVLHVLENQTELLSNPQFLLSTDRGYSENFQYLKMLGIVFLLSSLFMRTRAVPYLIWAILFGYLLLDDICRIHETVGGEFIGDLLQRMPLTSSADTYRLGQIIFALVVGGLILSTIMVTVYFSRGFVRRTLNWMLILLFGFAFFSVFVDCAGDLLPYPRPVDH